MNNFSVGSKIKHWMGKKGICAGIYKDQIWFVSDCGKISTITHPQLFKCLSEYNEDLPIATNRSCNCYCNRLRVARIAILVVSR